jgi:hypothetical protein
VSSTFSVDAHVEGRSLRGAGKVIRDLTGRGRQHDAQRPTGSVMALICVDRQRLESRPDLAPVARQSAYALPQSSIAMSLLGLCLNTPAQGA